MLKEAAKMDIQHRLKQGKNKPKEDIKMSVEEAEKANKDARQTFRS